RGLWSVWLIVSTSCYADGARLCARTSCREPETMARPFDLSYLPETPSQTAGPYVHIGLIPAQAGFEIFANNFTGDIAGPSVKGERIIIEGRVFDGAGHTAKDILIETWQANAAGPYNHP